jgi:hypothetical protein
VPAADPASRSIEFPAVYNGAAVIATAIVHSDQVAIVASPGQMLEVELHVWEALMPRVTVAAHTRPA